jgi:hypothetical protein
MEDAAKERDELKEILLKVKEGLIDIRDLSRPFVRNSGIHQINCEDADDLIKLIEQYENGRN